MRNHKFSLLELDAIPANRSDLPVVLNLQHRAGLTLNTCGHAAAAWPSKVALLERSGYRLAKLRLLKKPV